MRYGFGALGIIVVVCLSIAGVAVAAHPPLGFVKAEAISTSCALLRSEGVQIPVRNETAVRQKVHAVLSLSDKQGHPVKVTKACGGLEKKVGPKPQSTDPIRP